jgi:FkbM family methyltransferase
MTALALVRKSLKHVLPSSWYWEIVAWQVGYFDLELRLLPYLCDRTKVAVDVGASVGDYTVHLLNHSRKCYAFEPRPEGAAYLAWKLGSAREPRLRVETVALSDSAGEAQLRIPANEAGRSSLDKANPLEQLGTLRVSTVPMRRLDDYEDMETVGCIKIDVEGHEDAVLRGARRLLIRDHPSLIVEIEERHKRDSVRTVTEYLRELGYKGFFFRDDRLNPIASFRVDKHQDMSNIVGNVNKDNKYINNFVFLADESLPKVRHLIANG